MGIFNAVDRLTKKYTFLQNIRLSAGSVGLLSEKLRAEKQMNPYKIDVLKTAES